MSNPGVGVPGDVATQAQAVLENVEGPWCADGEPHSLDDGTTESVWDVDGPNGGWVARCQDERTAAFIAAAPTLIQELVATLQLVRKQAALLLQMRADPDAAAREWPDNRHQLEELRAEIQRLRSVNGDPQ